MSVMRWSETIRRAARRLAAALSASLLVTACARGQGGEEQLDRAEGRTVSGRIEGDARSGFRFVPRDGGAPIALEPGATIRRDGPEPVDAPGGGASGGPPPFRLVAGPAAQLSGTIRALGGAEVRWAPAWAAGEITVARGGVQAIVQRPGEARVLADGFETIDAARWSVGGRPTVVDRPRLEGDRSLRLPAEGASLTHDLEPPLAAGRLELAFHDDGAVIPGRECVVEPIFRGATGRAAIRIVLGWGEEGLGVETPGGPSLQVQRLVRSQGWHRLVVRFGAGETEISVDGRELAHGRQPGGPLVALRLATRRTDPASTSGPPPASFDDLRLVRFAEPPASIEIDPAQDEARLVVGDQIFGEVREADAERILMAVEGRPVALRWGEVAGLYFRRTPSRGATVDGLLVRAEWRAAPGDRPADLDFAEGALLAASGKALTLATPFAGALTLPRGAIRRLAVLGRGRRVVLDVAAHHLGDEVSLTQPLDPPQPEGLALERSIELAAAPDGPAEVVLDVVQVVPEAGDSDFSNQIRDGKLRTYLAVNGRRLDYINRLLKTPNETPERVRIPIPGGLLRAGRNLIRIELAGDDEPRPRYDDLGILQVAVEFRSPGPGPRVPE